ncbi:uncharacterized protein C14orf93 homolog [Spea bombifrons]|uniref:uncharacterized protein C14orf93 homolog n=1 Tax=Spea bombifrons TaxID=233779 RepID=UPI002349F1CA|nr:uncharacterized protein C14orf93 homolog [Spea bombifrons]
MSFSATILFSPPSGQNEGKCGCKNEGSQGGSVHAEGVTPIGVTPITVTGQGVAVQGCDQLLHLIYQRVEKAVGLAEAALGVAKANSTLLSSLQEEVSSLRKLCEKPERDQTPIANARCKTPDDEEEVEEIGSVQVVIEELRQLGAASASLVSGLHPPSLDKASREGSLPSGPTLAEATPLLSPMHVQAIDDFLNPEVSAPRILAPSFVKQLTAPRPNGDIMEALNESPTPVHKSTHSHLLIQRDSSLSPSGLIMAEATSGALDMRPSTSPPLSQFYTGSNSRQKSSGQKCSRRKRDLVLSKLVHNIHNHISNNKRFNGSESIKSSWNISVLKFLVEKLRQELVSSIHNYTDKELKGACVAYFLTKRREYRNSMNPFKSLKEKEEKKLRSRRYRLFANRSWGVQQFSVEDQALWEGVTEELMSDEEDSLSEPGVWVARPPRFRAAELSRLCYSIDSHSKHGNKANRVYGALSDRLPSAEVKLLPPHLYNSDWERENYDEGEPEDGETGRKSFCPDLNSYIQIKVEKDE